MNWNFMFFVNSILLGFGLAMDAFSVSMTNGLNEPKMKVLRMSMIAGVYALFQFIMPMIGWICIHTIVVYFQSFDKFIPWIALILLVYIGGKMLIEGIKNKDEDKENDRKLPFATLIIQGIATSIDALSVGFTIADYKLLAAILASLIIAIVTYGICMIGLVIGKKIGTKLSNKASILGGLILIGIGIEIFVKNIFF
ncbi:MAG: manganese efflux pump MntP family protein [Treponema sp.]|nr:manganese efflux pump MntP family protein [Treponema sp.]